VQVCASTGTVGKGIVGGIVGVTSTTGDDEGDVQPASRTAAMQMRMSAGAYVFIQKNDPLWHVLNPAEMVKIFTGQERESKKLL
jgi:hypothetical protein